MKRILILALVVLPSLVHSRTNESLPTYQFTYGSGLFQAPRAIACGGDSLVFVADELAWTVEVFTESGSHVTSFPVGAKPAGIAVAPDGTVWVACAESCLVRAFTPAGTPIRTLYSPAHRDSIGNFEYPRAVACLADGSIHVSCDWRDRILHFSPTGTFLGELGTIYGGGNTGAFYYVPQLAVFPDGSLFFGVPYDAAVHHWTQDGTELPTFSGLVGMSPYGVAVDAPTGRAWVSGWQTILQFSAAGDTAGRIAAEPGKWENPTQLAVDHHGRLHVLTGAAVARFGTASTPARTETWGAIKARYR